jgi:predicted restriction endonuclease
MRRALIVRDRTCQYPGCTVPGQWCDAHHRKHWALGGGTALHNLILLCAFHHTRLHLAGEWIMSHTDGRVSIGTDTYVAEHLLDERSHDHIDDHPDRQVA